MSRIVIGGTITTTFLEVGLASTGDLIALDMVDREENAI